MISDWKLREWYWNDLPAIKEHRIRLGVESFKALVLPEVILCVIATDDIDPGLVEAAAWVIKASDVETVVVWPRVCLDVVLIDTFELVLTVFGVIASCNVNECIFNCSKAWTCSRPQGNCLFHFSDLPGCKIWVLEEPWWYKPIFKPIKILFDLYRQKELGIHHLIFEIDGFWWLIPVKLEDSVLVLIIARPCKVFTLFKPYSGLNPAYSDSVTVLIQTLHFKSFKRHQVRIDLIPSPVRSPYAHASAIFFIHSRKLETITFLSLMKFIFMTMAIRWIYCISLLRLIRCRNLTRTQLTFFELSFAHIFSFGHFKLLLFSLIKSEFLMNNL